MTPREIKANLMLSGVTQSEIADRANNVSRGHVGRVITGQSISDPVQREIARAIGLPVERVFPERYKGNQKIRVNQTDQRIAV